MVDLIHILRGYMIHESKKEDPKALVFTGDFGDITDEQTRQTVHINVLDQLQRKFLARNKDGNHLFEVIDVQYPEETGGTVDAQEEAVLVKVVEKRRYPLHDRTGIFVVNTQYQVMWCLDEVTCMCNKQVLAGFPCWRARSIYSVSQKILDNLWLHRSKLFTSHSTFGRTKRKEITRW